MKYLEKQIEKVVKTKNKAKSDLMYSQNALADYIKSHSNLEPKFPVSESDVARYTRDFKEYYELIAKCDAVLAELVLLKEINEDL